MYAWEAIQKATDYIEEHLGEEILLETLAAEAALSPFYFQRLFSRLVKKPVREYIRYRRLAKACRELSGSRDRILDIALECGFGSHESLTRVFKDAYGMTPEQYRKQPVMLNQFDKPDLLLNYTMIDEGVPLISEGIILEFNRRTLDKPIRFLGLTGIVPIAGQMPLGEQTGVDVPGEVWNRFHLVKHRLPRIPEGREIGVAYMGDASEGSFTYFAGSEVGPGVEAEGFTAWELPAREYVICGFEAASFEELVTVAINKAVKYCGPWLKKHGLTQELYSPELYYDSSPEGTYMELWIPAEKASV